MKNKKGEIATLLTLGLVLVGSLITLGTSLFVNSRKTNLASNSRAASNCQRMYCANDPKNYFYYLPGNGGKYFAKTDDTCSKEVNATSICVGGGSDPTATPGLPTPKPTQGQGGGPTVQPTQPSGGGDCQATNENNNCDDANNDGVPCPNRDCCFCKNGKLMVFASAQARVNSQMSAPCENNKVEQSYKADGPAFYCGGTGGSGGGGNNGGGGKPGSGCITPSTTCASSVPGGATNDLISIDKDLKYYEGINCKKEIGNISAVRTYCIDKIRGNCDPNPISCLDATNDSSSANKDMRVKTSTGKIEYFTLDDQNCRTPLTEKQIKTLCFPKEKLLCNKVNCQDILGSEALNIPIYSREGEDGIYYNAGCDDPSLTKEEIGTKCLPEEKPKDWSVIGETVSYNGKDYLNCLQGGAWHLVSTFQIQCKNLGGLYVVTGSGRTDKYCCQP